MNITQKTNLLDNGKEMLDTLIEQTNKPYLNTGDSKKLRAGLVAINRATAELTEYQSLINTRLRVRPPYEKPAKKPVDAKSVVPVFLDVPEGVIPEGTLLQMAAQDDWTNRDKEASINDEN